MSRLLLPVVLGVGAGVASKYVGKFTGLDVPDIVPYAVGATAAIASGVMVYLSYVFDDLDISTTYREPIYRKGE